MVGSPVGGAPRATGAPGDAVAGGATDPATFFAGALDVLVRTGVLLTGSRAAAEDLVMTAVERTLPRWATIRDSPLAYVRRAVLHEFLSGRRRRAVVDERPTADVPDAAGTDHHARAELRLDLLTALAALPPRQRAVVVLRYFSDLTGPQIARELGVGEGTVRSQLHDALVTLRERAPATLRGHLPDPAEPPGEVLR